MGTSLFPQDDKKPSPLGAPLFEPPSLETDRLGQAVRLGAQQKPDSAARVLSLQTRTGLSPDLISRNLDEIEKQASAKDFDAERFRRESPIVAAWMAEHPTHAAAAMDDLSQLSKIEGALVALKRGFRIGREQSETGEIGFEQLDKGSLTPEQKARLDALNADISREPVGRDFFQTALFQSSKIAGQMLEGLPSALHYGALGAGAGATAGLVGGPLAPASAPAGALAGLGVGATAGMAGYTFVVEAGQSYQDMKQIVGETGEKLSDGAMRAAATGVGAINAVLEIAGLHFIAAPFQKVAQKFAREVARDALVRPTMRAALTEFGKNYVGAIAGESSTEVLQEISSITGEEIAKMVSNGHFASIMNDPEQREMAVQRLVDIAKQTAEGMLLVGLPGASINLAADVVQARKAQQRADFYTALGESVKESKTFNRLPEKLQDIISRATADGPMETAYVDVQPFIEYFQSKNLDPREVAREVMGSTEEFDQAVATRGAMAIPMARYATRLAPTEHNAFFAREIRRAPDEINAREADELEAQAAEAAKTAPDEQAAADARETLTKTVASQIEATGRFKGQDAETLASQMAAFFTTQGKRYGIDPMQLFNRYGLQVLRGEPDVQAVPRPANPLPDDQLQLRMEAGIEQIVERRAMDDAEAAVKPGESTLRTASGSLPTTLSDATTQQLADELYRLIEANQEDGALVVPTVSDEANVSHRDGYLAHHVGMKGAAVYASGRIKARNQSIARLEAELTSRGEDPMALYAKIAAGETLDPAVSFNPQEFEQAAYHGSPHIFDQFSLHAIGTGEGAQAYGWGLYFAGKKEIAEYYRKVLGTRVTVFGRAIEDAIAAAYTGGKVTPESLALTFLNEAFGDIDRAIENIKRVSVTGSRPGSEYANALPGAVDALEDLRRQDAVKVDRSGRLYKVEIPEDDTYLLWDRPLSEQPAAIRDAVVAAFRDRMIPTDVDFDGTGEGYTGEALYRELVREAQQRWDSPPENAAKAASEFLAALGVNGIKYPDGSSRGQGEGSYNYVIFDDKLVEIVEFEQRKGEGQPRGRIRIMPDRKMAIDLLQGADFSTFLHESGHFYLEVLKDLAGENPENAADFQAILKFLGVQRAEDIGREQHERFARAIEAYFMQGQAPTIELRRAFYRFKAWLKALYTSIRALEVELTPQVTRVFDRLFATDAEIDAAENEGAVVPVFTTAEAAGMSETEFAAYRQTVEDAHILATDKLRAKAMRDEIRQTEAWWKEARAAVRAEVEGETNQEPVYRALALLQRGEMPDGTKSPEPIKLSKESIVEAKGADFLKRLPRPYIYAKEGGITIDQAAELLGFSSGDELLTTIANAPNRNQVIEAETDRRMTAQYGDMIHDGKLVDAAEQSVLDEQRAEIIRAELRALNKRARDVKPHVDAAKQEAKGQQQTGRKILGGVPSIETVRQMAKDRIAQLQIRHIRPHTFWVAARKAGQEAFALAAKDDFVGAANAKQAELLNVELYREAVRIRAETDAIAEYARGLMRRPAQQRLGKAGWEYLEQINALLERFDFSVLPLSEGQRRQSLAAFIKAQEEKGLPVNIPDDIQNEAFRTPWKDMTYSELAGVRDVMKHIEHLATLKNKLLTIADQRALDEATVDARRSIEEHAKKTLPPQVETRLPGEQAVRAIDGWFGAHRKLSSLMREFDGFKDNGVLWNLIVRPLNAAADKKAEMNAAISQKLAAIWDAHYSKSERAAMYRKEYVPSIHASLTKMGKIMIALNWGAEDNREKLMAGLAISTGHPVLASDVEAVIDTLDGKDMEFVQAIWDAIGEYWPELSALAERLDGVPPEKIEAASFTNRHGTYRGGYFPLVYDDRQSRVAHRNLVAKTADALKRGAAARNSTKSGARHERVTGVQMPVRLDFGVIFEHFESIAQDITHTETLIDLGRIIGSDDVEDAIRAHYGDNTYKLILSALEDIAAGDVPAQGWFDTSLNWIRVGTSIAGLGWNITTSFLQPLGLTQSMVRIGPKWVGKGLARWIRDAASMENSAKWIQEKSPFMRTRTSTQMREIAEIRNRIGLSSGRLATYVDMGISKATIEKLDLQDLEDSYFWLITRMQLVADIPTWLGGYEKALASGADEATAIALADQGVIDAQGSGTIKDLAEVQRGNPALKLWTNFYSFFNTTWNLHVEALGRTNMKSPASVGRLAVDLLLLSTVPAVAGYLLKAAIRGDDDDDGLAEALAREQVGYLLNMLVGVRELSSAVSGFHGYEGPAGARFFSEIGKLVKQVGQGDADQAAFRALNSSAGILFHYPAGQVQRTVEGFMALEEGRTHNPAALLFGAPRK